MVCLVLFSYLPREPDRQAERIANHKFWAETIVSQVTTGNKVHLHLNTHTRTASIRDLSCAYTAVTLALY